MTTYDLLIAGQVDFVRLRAALAVLAAVPVDEVDIADDEVAERNWQAAVLCTYRPMTGDIAWILDVYLSDAAPVQPDVAEAADELARALHVPVLYDAGGMRPSAHWLAAPDGPRTRARVYDGPDDIDDGSLVIDAVERPVALLPGVRVERQPEVIKDHPVALPILDAFEAGLARRQLSPEAWSDLKRATGRLGSWEAMTARMAAGWPPDGWYPREYYDEDLAIRDELSETRVPVEAVEPFQEALAEVDHVFRAHTREVEAEPDGRWWRGRLPDPVPWSVDRPVG